MVVRQRGGKTESGGKTEWWKDRVVVRQSTCETEWCEDKVVVRQRVVVRLSGGKTESSNKTESGGKTEWL